MLILGSMPGQKSLADAEYYAHPRNAFWPIMEKLFAIKTSVEYQQRLQLLNNAKVGLWDVYSRCYRPGSLDFAIDVNTAEINNFSLLLEQYPNIHTILFNGKAAEKAFTKIVLPEIDVSNVTLNVLPSTSPANASINFNDKLAVWQLVKEVVIDA